MTYTLEEVRSFGARLHINTFLGITFNSLAAYIILKYSTPIMGNYKYYILSTVFFAFLMDFHLSFIYGMFPLFPYNSGCPSGIARYLGPFWGSSVQLGILHFTLSFCGLSIFFGIVYQYLSITNNSHFLKTLKGGICVALFMLFYPLPSFICYLRNYSYPQFLEHLKRNDPNLVEFFIAASCGGQVITKSTIAYIIVCTIQILTVSTSTTIFFFKIIKKLSEEKYRMSTNTLKMRKQYFKALIIQFLLPGFFVLVPVLFLIAMIFLNFSNINVYSQICIQFMSLHSVANALTIMTVIKSYRQIFIRFFTTVFSRTCEKKSIYPNSDNVYVK